MSIKKITFDQQIKRDYDVEELESSISLKYLNIVDKLSVKSTADSLNWGRDNAVKEMTADTGEKLSFKQAQWSAVMDGRVCDYCAERDAMVIATSNPDYYNYQPPAHFNCRCIWVYIAKEDIEEKGEERENTWASPDGDKKKELKLFNLVKDSNINQSEVDDYLTYLGEKSARYVKEEFKAMGFFLEDLIEAGYITEEIIDDFDPSDLDSMPFVEVELKNGLTVSI